MRSYWIIQVGPTSNDKCPFKKKAGGDLRPVRHIGEGNVKAEAKTGMKRLQAKEG